MDLSKLTPAPWTSVGPCEGNPVMPFALAVGKDVIAWFKNEADCDHAERARLAFDVMMRRGWSAIRETHPDYPGWIVVDDKERAVDCSPKKGTKEFPIRPDPFTALVEADKWYRENVEDKQ